MIKKKITCAALLVLMFSCISSAASDTARAVPSDDVIKNEQSSDDNITEKPEEIQVTVADEKLNEAPEPVTEAVVTAPEEKQEQHENRDKEDEPFQNQPEPQSIVRPDDMSGFEGLKTEYVAVQDVVVSEFKKTMYIDDTQNLSATVFPSTATDHDIYYSSSDWSVAKVDKLGKVTAVGSGTCTIGVSCGGKYAGYSLEVKVKTEGISVKSKYIVLKPGDEYSLEAKAVPDKASQSIKYKSQNKEVVTVSENGVLKAVGNGSTSVLITNDDYTMSVNVIVNTEGAADPQNEIKENSTDSQNASADSLAEKIRNSAEEKIVVNNTGKITSEALKALYGTDKTLIVECEDYDIYLNGRDVINADNELSTELNFTETSKGLLVSQKDDKKLPGKISIKLKNDDSAYRYIYLCREDGESYRKLNTLTDRNMFSISSAGEYLITEKKAVSLRISIVWILGAAGVILAMSVIYIFTKRKYWFW